MVGGNNNYYKMKIITKIFSGFHGPLMLLFIYNLFSCNNTTKQNELPKIEKHIKNDSIGISIELPPATKTGFNIQDKYDNTYYLEFVNSGKKDSTISKSIYNHHSEQIISYWHGFATKDTLVRYRHYYYLDSSAKTLKFKFKEGDVILENSVGKVIIVDKMMKDYEKLRAKIFKAKNKYLEKYLDSLYNNYKTKYYNNNILNDLNKLNYLKWLQSIYPSNDKVEKYLKTVKKPMITGGNLSTSICYLYVRDRIDKFDFKELNIEKYNMEYLRLMARGIFNFLRIEDNKGNIRYKPAIEWLKTTDLYKNDSIYVKKEILPLNNTKFRSYLKYLSTYDTEFNKVTFSEILKHSQHDYYLLDFWATWCAPCISGIKKIKALDIPDNLAIINLSVDKLKDKSKWQSMSENLNLEVDYLINEEEKKNREFLEFIELHTIPRYILIDRNMNLIDIAYLSPTEPNFLKNLQNIKD